jgi:hypothetical protein
MLLWLASNAAGSSVAASNDWHTSIYLILKFQVRLSFPKHARVFFLLEFRPSPNPFVRSLLRNSMVQPDSFIAGR